MGQETVGILAGANRQQREDRDVMERLLGHNEKVNKEINHSNKVIEEMELSILIKVGLMYATAFLLFVTILVVILKKIFF